MKCLKHHAQRRATGLLLGLWNGFVFLLKGLGKIQVPTKSWRSAMLLLTLIGATAVSQSAWACVCEGCCDPPPSPYNMDYYANKNADCLKSDGTVKKGWEKLEGYNCVSDGYGYTITDVYYKKGQAASEVIVSTGKGPCPPPPSGKYTSEEYNGGTDSGTGTIGEVILRHNDPPPLKMNLTVSKTGTGTVTGTPEWLMITNYYNPVINCGTDCTKDYKLNERVTLTATASTGFIFAGWGGACSGTSPTVTVTMNEKKSCAANFTQIAFALTTAKVGNGTITGNGNYAVGATVNLTATPAADSTFKGWSPSPCANSFVMPTNALTCTANFALKNYPVNTSLNPVAGGSISCNQNPVNHGSNSVCTVTANAGYTFNNFSGDCSGTSCTLDNVNSAKTVNANFVLKTYTITTPQVNNGKIEPPYLQLEHGKTAQFSLIPDIGYELDTVQGCGAGTISPQRTSYIIPAISNDCQISATFKRKVYPVTLSVNPANSGTIGIASPVTIKHGESSTFTITPASGYEIGGVSGCNAGLQSGNTYTTGIITDICNVSVYFIVKGQVLITTKTNGNGSIDPQGKSLDKGSSTVFTLMPKTGYEIDSVSGCNGSRNPENNAFFTTGILNDNCEIIANFKPIQYRITTKINGGIGGSIDPMFSQVEYGKNTKFTIIPSAGYEVENVEGCSGHFQDNQFTTGSIDANCEITAYFKLRQWTVTSSINGIGGEIKPISQSIQHGQAAEINLIPDTGYEVNEVTGTCNGSRKGNIYTTNAITANCSVITSFKIKGYSIQSIIRPSGAGFIKPTSNSVEYGKTVDFSVGSNDGYNLDIVRGCNDESIIPTNGIYTTRPITRDCTLSADFISKKYEVKLTSQYTNKPSESVSLGFIEHGQVKQFPLPILVDEKAESIIGCGGKLEGSNYTTGNIISDCEITIFFQPTISQCSTFNVFAHPQAFVPCVKVGDSVFEAGMNMISASPIMRFEVDKNTLKQHTNLIPNQQCAIFPAPNTANHLKLNCLDVENDKYWVEMSLVNNPDAIQFDLVDFGKI